MDDLLKSIRKVCEKIAERDGFQLPPVGGYRIRKDGSGLWEFIHGEGMYMEKDGHMQWILK